MAYHCSHQISLGCHRKRHCSLHPTRKGQINVRDKLVHPDLWGNQTIKDLAVYSKSLICFGVEVRGSEVEFPRSKRTIEVGLVVSAVIVILENYI